MEDKQLSVLVVDDDQKISKMIRCNLEDTHTRVFEAPSGLDCMAAVLQSKVDLVLLDIKLPDFNGWGILSLFRLTEPLRDIPVIMVSVEPPDTALINSFSPDDYIQKPFDIGDLLVRVKKVINSRKTK